VTKSLKYETITLFIMASILVVFEIIMLESYIYARLNNEVGVEIGYIVISFFMFVFRACLITLALLCVFDMGEHKGQFKRYYILSIVSVILFSLPLLSTIIIWVITHL